MFVVDSSDVGRIPIVAEILEIMARHPNLLNRKIPFQIVANKQDLDGALQDTELHEALGIDKLKNIANNELIYAIKEATALKGYGVRESLKFIEKNSK